MTNEISLKQIDELRKFETLKKQYACLLFKHHKHIGGELKDGKNSAYKAAEEFVQKLYPFVLSNSTGLISYIASTWPNDQAVFNHYMLMKEAEAQGEFLPNKAQLVTIAVNLLDEIDVEIAKFSKRSKRYKEAMSLRNQVLEGSKLVHDFMGWQF